MDQGAPGSCLRLILGRGKLATQPEPRSSKLDDHSERLKSLRCNSWLKAFALGSVTPPLVAVAPARLAMSFSLIILVKPVTDGLGVRQRRWKGQVSQGNEDGEFAYAIHR